MAFAESGRGRDAYRVPELLEAWLDSQAFSAAVFLDVATAS